MQRAKVLICLLYAFSCNKALNKPNNNSFGINCFFIFLKSVISTICIVVQQSALSSPNENVCVYVCVQMYVCLCANVCRPGTIGFYHNCSCLHEKGLCFSYAIDIILSDKQPRCQMDHLIRICHLIRI